MIQFIWVKLRNCAYACSLVKYLFSLRIKMTSLRRSQSWFAKIFYIGDRLSKKNWNESFMFLFNQIIMPGESEKTWGVCWTVASH